MNDEMPLMSLEDDGTQIVTPAEFRYPSGWLSWQAVVGDLATRGHPDARLRLEAVGSVEGPQWGAELEWGENQERTGPHPTLSEALIALWWAVMSAHGLYAGDPATRGPGAYGHDDYLDGDTQAVIQRVLTVLNAAFGREWALLTAYHPVANAAQRIHMRLIARRGEVALSASGATLIDAARALLRVATPYFPKQSRGL